MEAGRRNLVFHIFGFIVVNNDDVTVTKFKYCCMLLFLWPYRGDRQETGQREYGRHTAKGWGLTAAAGLPGTCSSIIRCFSLFIHAHTNEHMIKRGETFAHLFEKYT